jgi:deoxyhypusine synthase
MPATKPAAKTFSAVLERMERISFQGRNLGTARRIWEKMLAIYTDQVFTIGTVAAVRSRHRHQTKPPSQSKGLMCFTHGTIGMGS